MIYKKERYISENKQNIAHKTSLDGDQPDENQTFVEPSLIDIIDLLKEKKSEPEFEAKIKDAIIELKA